MEKREKILAEALATIYYTEKRYERERYSKSKWWSCKNTIERAFKEAGIKLRRNTLSKVKV